MQENKTPAGDDLELDAKTTEQHEGFCDDLELRRIERLLIGRRRASFIRAGNRERFATRIRQLRRAAKQAPPEPPDLG